MKYFSVTLCAFVALLLQGCGGGSNSSSAVSCDETQTCPAGGCTISGRLSFDRVPIGDTGLDFNNVSSDPVRGVVVELRSANNTLLDSTISGGDGSYQLTVQDNQAVRVRALAQVLEDSAASQWDYRVVDNTANQSLYVMAGNLVCAAEQSLRDLHAASGWTGAAYTEPRVAAPFAILDSMYKATLDFVAAAVPETITFPLLTINWSENNVSVFGDAAEGDIGTSKYDSETVQIFLLGDFATDSDEYDEHVVIHEWNHYFTQQISRTDTLGGSHGIDVEADMRLSYDEGISNAVSAIVLDRALYQDTFMPPLVFSLNLEETPPALRLGWWNETAIGSLVYDIYDDQDDDADTVSLGLSPIYQALINGVRNTPALVSVFPFVEQIKSIRPSDATAIDALIDALAITSTGLTAFAPNEINQPSSGNALPVYAILDVSGFPSQQLLSHNIYGTQNRLGNYRFLRLTIPSAGDYLITVAPQSNLTNARAGMQIFQQGQLLISRESTRSGALDTSVTLAAGQYVISIFDVANVTAGPGTSSAFTVSALPQ